MIKQKIIFVAFFAAALWIVGCSGAPAQLSRDQSIKITAVKIQLDPERSGPIQIGSLIFITGFDLTARDVKFGGYSGLYINPEGTHLIAISDRGHWLDAEISHDQNEQLTGINIAHSAPILDMMGQSIIGTKFDDAEALTRLSDGSFLVAFEDQHRVWRYNESGGTAKHTNYPPDIGGLPRNNGIEALVALPPNDLLMLSEGVGQRPGFTQGWLLHDGDWSKITVRTPDGFKPTDLALLPNGDVIMVERYFTLIGGTKARLSRLRANEIRPGTELNPEVLATLEAPFNLDNLEGIATRRGPSGSTLIYLISDNNMSPLQRTLLFQFRLNKEE